MTTADFPALLTAFLVGFLGSGHCFGMCGGIAAGLGTVPVQTKKGELQEARPHWTSAFLFNLGRVATYTFLGLIAAFLLGGAGEMLNVPRWSMILRLLTALMIFLIGFQFLFNVQALAIIERGGAKIWNRVLPVAVRVSSLPGGTGRLLVGFCWGFLPCGLVYSVLLTASAAGSPVSGAMVMLAFGVGTLPAMLGMGLAAPALVSLLNDRWARRFLGAALILLAVLSVTLMAAKVLSSGAEHQMHQHGSLSPQYEIIVTKTT
jgi:sulfite exporter TauE/SafE